MRNIRITCLILTMLGLVFGLTSFQPTVLAATGSISANPQLVIIADGQSIGTTTITWSTSGCTTAQVWVSTNGSAEQLFAQGPYGSAQAPWIGVNAVHIFKLYAETSHTTLLGKVVVMGVRTGVQLVANPKTVRPAAGQVGTVYIASQAPGYPNAVVCVQADNETTEKIFAGTGVAEAPWISQGHTYEFRLYTDSNRTNCLKGVHVSGNVPWSVGVNYFTTTANMSGGFIQTYNQPTVRATVQSQLLAMANAGVTHVQLTMWMSRSNPATPVDNNEVHFPPTAQELANLRQYAQDVAAIQANQGQYSGRRLKLSVVNRHFAASAYSTRDAQGYVGTDHLPQATWLQYDTAAYQTVINNIYDINRPDGQKVIDTMYLEGEVSLDTPYTDWYLSNQWANFHTYCTNRGLKPAIYFMADGLFNNVFDNGYIDAQYPILNGHRSVVGIYRPLAFMKQQGWSLPTTIDFSCFLDTAYSDAATLNAIMQRIADDLDAVLPSVKARCQYRCAEVQFPQDAYQPGRRANLGAAYKAQYADDKGQRLTAVCIWPDDGLGHFVAPAELTAHIADYLP